MPEEKYDVDQLIQEIKERRAQREQSGAPARSSPETAKTAFVQPRKTEADLSRLLEQYASAAAADTAKPTPQRAQDARSVLLDFGDRSESPAQTAPKGESSAPATYPPAPAAPAPSAPTNAADAFANNDWGFPAEPAAPAQTAVAEKPEIDWNDETWGKPARGAKRASGRVDDFGAIAQALATARRGAIAALIVSLVCAIAVVYLGLAPIRGLPVPALFAENYAVYLWTQVALVVVSALSCGGMVGGGMAALFTRRSSNYAYTALAVFACLLHGAYLAMKPDIFAANPSLLYLPVAAVILLASALGRLVDTDRRIASCRICGDTTHHPGAAIALRDTALTRRIAGARAQDPTPQLISIAGEGRFSGFAREAASTSRIEDVSRIVAPITAAAALVMALVSYFFFSKEVFTACCVFTAALAISSPISAALASALPLHLLNKRVGGWGAAYAGYHAAETFSIADGVLLPAAELLPEGCVSLQGMKVFNKIPVEQSIPDAAALLLACDSPLAPAFSAMLSGRGMTKKPDNLTIEPEQGVSAWIDGRRVLAGNRALMQRHGIPMPEASFDARYAGDGKTLLFVSTAGQLAAAFILSWTPDKYIRRALALCAAQELPVLIYTGDPNAGAAIVTSLYNLPDGLCADVPAALGREAAKNQSDAIPAELCFHGGPASYVRAIAAARPCRGTVTTEAVLVLLSVIIGFALVTFLSFTGAVGALTWTAILLFQLFFAVLELLIALIRR